MDGTVAAMRGVPLVLLLGLACGSPAAPHVKEPSKDVTAVSRVAEVPRETWLKGQLHAHTDRSGDSETPVATALAWYAAHGFDFVVVTDHNFVTVADGGPVLAIPGVELTQNLERCDPPAETGRCPLHINALFVAAERAGPVVFPDAVDVRRRAVFGRALRTTRELGGLAQLNHPNFHYSADASLIADLVDDGVLLLEVANEAVDSNNEGDARHPNTLALWDAALSRGKKVYGVATDDAHHYEDAAAVTTRGEQAFVGDRGWVMVRARKDPAAIRAAIERGEFYASNGVTLTGLSMKDGTLAVETATPHTFIFKGADGKVLREARGTAASVTLGDGDSGYVRAEITAPDGRRAWTQPLWR